VAGRARCARQDRAGDQGATAVGWATRVGVRRGQPAPLNVDTVDLFLLHSWDASAPLDETLEALDTLVRQGKARRSAAPTSQPGSSAKPCGARREGLVAHGNVQETTTCRARHRARVDAAVRRQEVGVTTYSPLGGGFFTGKYTRREAAPAGTRFDVVAGMQPIYMHEAGFRVLAGLEAKAADLGTTAPLLALAWALTQPGITSFVGRRALARAGGPGTGCRRNGDDSRAASRAERLVGNRVLLVPSLRPVVGDCSMTAKSHHFGGETNLMTLEQIDALISTYRDGLLGDTLPFWINHAVDREFGGFLSCLDRDGTVIDTDKSVWIHGRFIWLLSPPTRRSSNARMAGAGTTRYRLPPALRVRQ